MDPQNVVVLDEVEYDGTALTEMLRGFKDHNPLLILQEVMRGADMGYYLTMEDMSSGWPRTLRICQWLLKLHVEYDPDLYTMDIVFQCIKQLPSLQRESQYKDGEGKNLMDWAIKTLHPPLIDYLIQRKATICKLYTVIYLITDDHIIYPKKGAAILDMLLQYGIYANEKDIRGRPLLMVALQAGSSPHIVQALLQNGANVDDTSMDYIQSGKLKEISIGYHNSIVNLLRTGKLGKKPINKLTPKTDLLDYVSDEELERVFGFTEESCTKLRSLLKSLDESLPLRFEKQQQDIYDFISKTLSVSRTTEQMEVGVKYSYTKESHLETVERLLTDTREISARKRNNVYVGAYSGGTASGSYKIVYKNSVYVDKDGERHRVAVGQMENVNDIILTDLFWESIIGMVLQKVCSHMKYIRAPVVHAIRVSMLDPNKVYIIQEWVRGKDFFTIRKRDARTGLLLLAKGLNRLQLKIGFMHRDLHAGNVMYDAAQEMVYLIDFGFACISMPKRKHGSIQNITNSTSLFSYVLKRERTGESYRSCVNKSHDMCTLFSSINDIKHYQNVSTNIRDMWRNVCWQYVKEVRTMKYGISKDILFEKLPFIHIQDMSKVRKLFFPHTLRQMDGSIYRNRRQIQPSQDIEPFDTDILYQEGYMGTRAKAVFDVDRFTVYCLAEIEILDMRPMRVYETLMTENTFRLQWDMYREFKKEYTQDTYQIAGIYMFLSENKINQIKGKTNLVTSKRVMNYLGYSFPFVKFYTKTEIEAIAEKVKTYTDLLYDQIQYIRTHITYGTHECVIHLMYMNPRDQPYSTERISRILKPRYDPKQPMYSLPATKHPFLKF